MGPKFNTHKKIVVHFFIPMLLLPLTPSLIYLKLKRFKGPKTDHFHFTTSWRPFLKNSPTCPKFNSHKKFVVHFCIPMLLLHLTPPLIYLKTKKFKGPKKYSALI